MTTKEYEVETKKTLKEDFGITDANIDQLFKQYPPAGGHHKDYAGDLFISNGRTYGLLFYHVKGGWLYFHLIKKTFDIIEQKGIGYREIKVGSPFEIKAICKTIYKEKKDIVKPELKSLLQSIEEYSNSNNLSKGENFLCSLFTCPKSPYYQKDIEYVQEYEIKELKGYHYWKENGIPRYDAALINKQNNSIMLFIEYDGRQHFDRYDKLNENIDYELVFQRDACKSGWAAKMNIPLLRIPYSIETIEEIYSWIEAWCLGYLHK